MHLRNRLLLTIGAFVLCAAGGSPDASAATLCKNNASTSACSETYPAGSPLSLSLKSGNKFFEENPPGTVGYVTCTGLTIEAETVNLGSATEAVRAHIGSIAWSGCTKEKKTLVRGELEIQYKAGTDNGTLTLKNTQVSTVGMIGGETCVYGAGSSGIDFATLFGGSPGTVSGAPLLTRQPESGVLCPLEERWEFALSITKPNPLFVAAS
jgi:hypothetical protein